MRSAPEPNELPPGPPGYDGLPGPPPGVAAWYFANAAAQCQHAHEEGSFQPLKGLWRVGSVINGEDLLVDEYFNGTGATRAFRNLLMWELDHSDLPEKEWQILYEQAKNVIVPDVQSIAKIREREFTVGDTTYYMRYMGSVDQYVDPNC